jgi:hypothetical protein
MSQVKILNDFLIPSITDIIMNYNLPKEKSHRIHTRAFTYKIIAFFGKCVDNNYSLAKICTIGRGLGFEEKDFKKFVKIKKIESWRWFWENKNKDDYEYYSNVNIKLRKSLIHSKNIHS